MYYVLGEETSFFKINGELIENRSRVDNTIKDIIKEVKNEHGKDMVSFEKDNFINRLKKSVENSKLSGEVKLNETK
jgi:hypothetical protein